MSKNLEGKRRRGSKPLTPDTMPRRPAAPVAPELDFDLCELCGNDMGMIPKGKVCCRLLNLNGNHDSRTNEWKKENQAGFTLELKQTSGRGTVEWTRRVWCNIGAFCHEDQFKVPGSTTKCCKKHRDFYKKCKVKSRAEDSKLENEGAHGKKSRRSLLKPQLLALARHQDTEIASLRKQLKRKHDEVEALQAEVKKLRQVSATELAGLEQDFINTVVAPEWTQGGTCNETLIPRTSSCDLNAFIYGDFPLALEAQEEGSERGDGSTDKIAEEGQAGLVFTTLLARLERRAKAWVGLVHCG